MHCRGQFRAVTVYRVQYSFDAFVVTGPHVNNLLVRDAVSGLSKKAERASTHLLS